MMSTTIQRPAPVARKRDKGKSGNGFTSLDGLLTVEQWVAIPDTKPRYELIEGKLVQKMTTNTAHAWAAGKFLFMCMEWARTAGWNFLPEGTGIKIDEHKGYVPDVVGFAPDAVLDPKANYNERPFLVLEVLSRSTSKKDRTDKLRDYARVGLQLYIIINIEPHALEIYRLHKNVYGKPEVLSNDQVWEPDELPGLRLELARLWL